MTGKYMIHCDPDDWIERNMYELMYKKAKSGNFDVVVCNLNYVYEDGKTVEVSRGFGRNNSSGGSKNTGLPF